MVVFRLTSNYKAPQVPSAGARLSGRDPGDRVQNGLRGGLVDHMARVGNANKAAAGNFAVQPGRLVVGGHDAVPGPGDDRHRNPQRAIAPLGPGGAGERSPVR